MLGAISSALRVALECSGSRSAFGTAETTGHVNERALISPTKTQAAVPDETLALPKAGSAR